MLGSVFGVCDGRACQDRVERGEEHGEETSVVCRLVHNHLELVAQIHHDAQTRLHSCRCNECEAGMNIPERSCVSCDANSSKFIGLAECVVACLRDVILW